MDLKLKTLINKDSQVYVATRLFDNGGRYFGALIEEAINNALSLFNSEKKELSLTYLPYRDSNETVSLLNDETITKAIYRIDCEKLSGSFLFVAPVYEIQLDSGIAFEIGYAFSKNVPTILVAGNFFNYKLLGHDKPYIVDPIFQLLADKIIDCGKFSLSGKDKTRRGYFDKLNLEFLNIKTKVADSVFLFTKEYSQDRNRFHFDKSDKIGGVHIEFGGSQFQHQELMLELMSKKLNQHNIGFTKSERHTNENYEEGLKKDIGNALASDLLVTLGDGSEVDPEIACIQGMAAAMDKKVVLLFTGKKYLSSVNDYFSPCNLMISESAAKICYSIDDTVPTIIELLT